MGSAAEAGGTAVPEGSTSSPGLRRGLGFWGVALSGVGVILGAGIYALIGPAAGRAGGALWLAFLAAGVVSALTAHSYARLSALHPRNAAEFQYLRAAFGMRAGFIGGWVMSASNVVAIAAISLGFAGYLQVLLPLPLAAGALLLIGLCGLLLWAGIRESVGFAVAFTLVELLGLLLVIAFGLPRWGEADYLEMPHGLAGIGGAAALIFFAYLGFEGLANMAEEARQPERVLPRAILTAVAITTAIYILVAVAVVSAVPWQQLEGSASPLALMVGTVAGPRTGLLLVLLALAATANTVLLMMLSVSRNLYGMGQAGALPRWLGRVGRRRTPWAATVAAALLAAGFALLGDLTTVAELSNGAVLLLFTMVNLALLVLWRRGEAPGSGKRALLPAAGAATCLALLLCTGWHGASFGLGMVALGLLASRLFVPKGSPT
ncbi:MAG: APC family permease [Halobacteria archaeon]